MHFNTYADFVKISLLAFGSYVNEGGLITAFKTAISKRHVLVENKFPYNVRKGIHHHVLISTDPLSESDVQELIDAQLTRARDVRWFVNDPLYLSIPELWHCHILWK